MANPDHIARLKKGVASWNAWRDENHTSFLDLREANLREADLSEANLTPANLLGADLSAAKLSRATLTRAILAEANLVVATVLEADLREANLSGANLSGANLSGADLREANLSEANLSEANLTGTDLTRAKLGRANLMGADLSKANLHRATLAGARLHGANLSEAGLIRANLMGADLSKANLAGTDLLAANLLGAKLIAANLTGATLAEANFNQAKLREANLLGANLQTATLVDTDLTGADLTGCRIFGVSVWRVKLDGATQQNLIITHPAEPEITVDDIEVAQFIHLLLHNEKLRHVIDTITSKVVLILGRFTDERKAVLNALREELRKRDYLPVLFDFEKPHSRTTDETITLLARMARFVIADLSDAKSVLQELRGIVPDLPSVAVQLLILTSQEEPGMFDFFRSYPWVLEPYRYDSQECLLANLEKCVVDPAEAKVLELRRSSRGL
jgi:uncharacterized protein YjbI with pentapeptide repeats